MVVVKELRESSSVSAQQQTKRNIPLKNKNECYGTFSHSHPKTSTPPITHQNRSYDDGDSSGCYTSSQEVVLPGVHRNKDRNGNRGGASRYRNSPPSSGMDSGLSSQLDTSPESCAEEDSNQNQRKRYDDNSQYRPNSWSGGYTLLNYKHQGSTLVENNDDEHNENSHILRSLSPIQINWNENMSRESRNSVFTDSYESYKSCSLTSSIKSHSFEFDEEPRHDMDLLEQNYLSGHFDLMSEDFRDYEKV